MGMTTISIAGQSNANTMATALCEALAAQLGDGWTLNDDYTVTNEYGVGFGFEPSGGSSNSIYLRVKGRIAFLQSSASVSGSANLELDICKSKNGGVIAVNVRAFGAKQQFQYFIAENENGEWAVCGTGGTTSYKIVHGEDVSATAINQSCHVASGLPCSFYKCPDIYSGCNFKELFAVYSSPTSNVVFTANAGSEEYAIFDLNQGSAACMFACPI